MKYTVDYFIDKFEAIPEDRWIVNEFINKDNQCCAFGHCGARNGVKTDESNALIEIFVIEPYHPVDINDGKIIKYSQSTPKQRILAALRDIKESLQHTEGLPG